MKRKLGVLLVIGIIIVLIGFIVFIITYEKNETKYKEINSIGESTSQVDVVSVTIKSGTLTKTSATIIITDENEETYSYGQAFKIEKKENGSWSEVEHITDDFAFILLAYNVGDDGTLEMVQDWEGLYGELESGTYRLVKGLTVNGKTRNFWVEFTIN